MKHRPYLRLKTTLMQRGITYQQLGLFLGISAAAICSKINGKSDFYLDEALRIEQAYQIPVEVFLYE